MRSWRSKSIREDSVYNTSLYSRFALALAGAAAGACIEVHVGINATWSRSRRICSIPGKPLATSGCVTDVGLEPKYCSAWRKYHSQTGHNLLRKAHSIPNGGFK